eukprot:scaffold549_cov385-Prasinococcus_capsulatus_cf.AAC.13
MESLGTVWATQPVTLTTKEYLPPDRWVADGDAATAVGWTAGSLAVVEASSEATRTVAPARSFPLAGIRMRPVHVVIFREKVCSWGADIDQGFRKRGLQHEDRAQGIPGGLVLNRSHYRHESHQAHARLNYRGQLWRHPRQQGDPQVHHEPLGPQQILPRQPPGSIEHPKHCTREREHVGTDGCPIAQPAPKQHSPDDEREGREDEGPAHEAEVGRVRELFTLDHQHHSANKGSEQFGGKMVLSLQATLDAYIRCAIGVDGHPAGRLRVKEGEEAAPGSTARPAAQFGHTLGSILHPHLERLESSALHLEHVAGEQMTEP